jgi:hypothetical protein
MRILFWMGLAALILGIISFLVPLPRQEREGLQVGGVSINVETRHEEKVSPIVAAAMLLGGAGMMIAGKRKSS